MLSLPLYLPFTYRIRQYSEVSLSVLNPAYVFVLFYSNIHLLSLIQLYIGQYLLKTEFSINFYKESIFEKQLDANAGS